MGTVAQFNGLDDRLTLGAGTLAERVNGAAAITLVAWTNVDTLPANDSTVDVVLGVVGFEAKVGLGIEFRDNSGTDYVRVVGRSQSADAFQQHLVAYNTTGEWTMFAGILDIAGDQLRLHVNGGAASSGAATFGAATFTDADDQVAEDVIGAGTSGAYFDGQIGPVLVYNRALTHPEIQHLYLDPLAPFRGEDQLMWYEDEIVTPPAPSGAYMPLLQKNNLGASLYNGTLA
jgi:hypothetical protein